MAERAFVANDAGFAAIANGPQIRLALDKVAEKGKQFAESISPYDPEDDNDHYRDSFEVRPTTIEWEGEYPGPRAAAELANTSGHAAAVEWGYAGRAGEPSTSAHRVLGRTLDFLDAE